MRDFLFPAVYVLIATGLTGAAIHRQHFGAACFIALLFAAIAGIRSSILRQRVLRANQALADWVERFSVRPGQTEPMDNQIRDTLPTLAQKVQSSAEQLTRQLESAERSRVQHARAVQYMVDGMLVVNHLGRVTASNPAARQMLGFTQESPIDRPLVDLIRIPEIVNAVERVLKERRNQELTVSTGSEQRRSIRIQVAVLPDDPQPGAVLTAHDETRIRALEQLRREFVANVSHELKTPLASVKGYAETLLTGALEEPPMARRFVEHIAQQAERLEFLITDMLRLARAQSAPDVLVLRAISVAEVLAASIAAYRPVAERKPVELNYRSPGPELMALADQESLLTVVNNLIGNAVRYTQQGGHVRVSGEAREKMCVITVEDDGPGIPEADQQRVFERFYRVEKSRDTLSGGTGLGLAIAKHLVLKMNGEIRLISGPQGGCRFEVHLPLPNAAENDRFPLSKGQS